MRVIFKHFATLGPVGYLPAPGTCASLFTLLLLYGISPLSLFSYFILIAILCLIAYLSITPVSSSFTHADPQEIVIDEAIGCLVTFTAVPLYFSTIMLGLIFFRFFDISKYCGVSWFEKLKGSWGIILDDVWAGIISCIVLHVLLRVGLV